MAKSFLIPSSAIRVVATGHGSCFATDRITVDGLRVGYMYREHPDNDVDSGWRFLAGDESEEYTSDADKLGLYDVNTIANYDPDIVPHLNAPFGSAFERTEEGFLIVAGEPLDPSLLN